MKKKLAVTVLSLALVSCLFAGYACAEAPQIDLDLTPMSQTMIYGVMFDVIASPERYAGQHMRLPGEYSVFKDAVTGEVEHTIIFFDSSGCCEVDMRFTLDETYTYPQDYPRSGRKMVLVGELIVEGEGKDAVCRIENGMLE